MTLNYAHHQPMYNSPPTITAPAQPQPAQAVQQQAVQLPTSPVSVVNNFSTAATGGNVATMNFSSLQPIHYNQLNQPQINGTAVSLPGV